MQITPQVYRAAAERLEALTTDDFHQQPDDAPFVPSLGAWTAAVWAGQFNAAADALEHHLAVTPTEPEECERCAADDQLAQALAGALYSARQRLAEPVPGLDDLDRVLDDLDGALRDYEAEIN